MAAAAVLALFWGLMAAACVFDLRERILPNGLALALAVCGLALALAPPAARGADAAVLARQLGVRAGWALAFSGVLLGSELVFKRVTGAPGLGMGDVKFAFGATAAYPLALPAAFCAGLLALAACGLALKRRALPCIPFVAAALLAGQVGQALLPSEL